MNPLKPYSLSAWQIASQVKLNPDLIADYLAYYKNRVRTHKDLLGTHLYWDEGHIDAQVEELKKQDIKQLPLAFVPIVIKDNICIQGIRTTCASKMLEKFVPPYSATVIDKLRKAGAILFGKANLDEFAMGSSNENSAFGPVLNPWKLSCVPGGSSGGSAAAVAADFSPVALGSDTGGSIRQPASFCGVVGVKPTYGRVSRYGLIAFASSLDQIGPLAKNVLDAALVHDVISGHDGKDSTSASMESTSIFQQLKNLPKNDQPLAGKRIGLIKEFFPKELAPEISAAIVEAMEVYRKLGAQVVELSLPSLAQSISTYYIIATAEASANLARFDGIRYGFRSTSPAAKTSLKALYQESRSMGFGAEVKRRIFLGTFVLSSGYKDAYYQKATRMRQFIKDDFINAFKQVDLLLGPTAPTTAFKLGEKTVDPLAMYLNDIFTIGVNLAGLPALSLPCGFDRQQLPIGMQLIAKPFDELTMFKGAYFYEAATQWGSKQQPCFA